MTAPTVARPGAEGPEVHGPAEVRAALEEHATAETLALYDRQIEQATVQALEQGEVAPLAAVLRHWWMCTQVASGRARPEDFGARTYTQAEVEEAWHRKHPGQQLSAA